MTATKESVMGKKIRKDLTKLELEEIKVIAAIICDYLEIAEKEIADNFKAHFTTRSFFEIAHQVIDCYLYDRFPNHTQAMKVIHEQHKQSEHDLKLIR
jgi:hypothetical protein